jgi:hypothetical protein
VATPKGGTFMLAGHDLGDIVGQWHPYGFFYRNDFQHYCDLLETPLTNTAQFFHPALIFARLIKTAGL